MASLSRLPGRSAAVAALFSGLGLFAGGLLLPQPLVGQDQGLGPAPAYVTTAVCAECHVKAMEAWTGSHHDWALRPANAGSVLGDFDDASIEHLGVSSRFFRDGARFMIETEGPKGRPATYEIAYAVGVSPLQQYLIELDGGRLQALSLAWDVAAERWYHLYPDRRIAHDDGLHWTGVYQNWNGRCADCHSTGYQKGYDPSNGDYASRWSDMNVGCEACHGPGEAHVVWARDPGAYDPSQNDTLDPVGLTLVLSAGNAEAEIQACAACHSRRLSLAPRSRSAGEAFADNFRLALLRDGLYHADGQILDEVYVYGSFLQSKMYAKGVRCSDCHDAHRLDSHADGNAVCTACHNPAGNPRFAGLNRGLFDDPSHHFHDVGGEGARCVNCHMQARTYMVIDPRRDHSFRVPRPDLSLALGTPNICTTCHDDKSDAWAVETLRSWYPRGRMGSGHYGEALAAGRAGLEQTNVDLLALAHETESPAIVRATALHLLRLYGPGEAQSAEGLLSSTEPLLRQAAAALQETRPAGERVRLLTPLLDDSARTVRIAAARLLVDVSPADVPPDRRNALAGAMREFQQSLLATADFPETQLNLSGLALQAGNIPAGEAALREALKADPYLVEAWERLGRLQHLTGRSGLAEITLRTGLAKVSEAPSLNATLGLFHAEQGEWGEAVRRLRRAAELVPEDARVRYNLALALQKTGDSEAAGAALAEALELAPEDRDILHALGLHELEQGRLDDAERRARKLMKLHPDRPEGRLLLNRIQERSSKD